jgi:hypothetical protein
MDDVTENSVDMTVDSTQVSQESAPEAVIERSPTGTARLHVVRSDTTQRRQAARRFGRATRATITRDEPMDAWRLEIWGDAASPLGLWPITDLGNLDDAAYRSIMSLLEDVGLTDDGRSRWTRVDDRWESPLTAVGEPE